MVKVLSKIAEPVINVNEVSRIAAGVVIKGDLTSPSDIRIDGSVEGLIQCDGRVVIGEKACIKGTVDCRILDVWGRIEGKVIAHDTLSMKNGASLEADIEVRRLHVEMGAGFNGTCRMISSDQE